MKSPSGWPGRIERREGGGGFGAEDLLRWIYIGRMALVTGILLGALLAWGDARAEQTFVATSMFLVTLVVTGLSVWHTHLLRRPPGMNFLYAQVVFDALVVTAVIHITGGGESNFAWLYILVISAGALLLPFAGGVLVGALAILFFFADIVWGHSETLTGSVLLQIGLFALVALVTGLLGDRLRRAGTALGAVQSELQRLRLDTGEILASISTGVLTVDERGRLLYVNPAGEDLLGLDGGQWQGAAVLEAVGEASPGLAALLRRTMEEGGALSRYKALVRRGSKEATLGVSTTVRAGEDSIAVTALFQDITELERLERVKSQNERLEAVAELSASMAHEIKNPLASIRSAVEQFSRKSLVDEDRDLLIRLVVDESDRLSRLLSEFIEFSRVRIGRVDDLDLCEILRDAVTLAGQHPDARPLELELTGDQEEAYVRGDGDLLHRAIFNLVLNAIQFAGEEGRVRVRLDRPGRDVEGVSGLLLNPVRIRVSDSGPGIPAKDLSRIFDPFFTTRKGGSGLGLALVHRAVEAHKGVILAGPGPDGGAEFTLFLPTDGAVGNGRETPDEVMHEP